MDKRKWTHSSYTARQLELRSERLLEAYKLVQGLTPKQFNMGTWMSSTWMSRVNGCNTVGCVAGWCGSTPWFQARRLVTARGNVCLMGRVIDYDTGKRGYGVRTTGYDACALFFHIDNDDSVYIFSPIAYGKASDKITRREVLARINSCIKSTLHEQARRERNVS